MVIWKRAMAPNLPGIQISSEGKNGRMTLSETSTPVGEKTQAIEIVRNDKSKRG
jgi:hypothetical protein